MKQKPQLLDLNRKPGQPKRRKKVHLVFDEEKRKDFLSGFHKRKLDRKKKAQEELQRQLKEERKKIKQNAKENLKKMLSHREIPELQEMFKKEEFKIEDRTVSILELDVSELEKRTSTIGSNKVKYEGDEDHQEEDEIKHGSGNITRGNKKEKIDNGKTKKGIKKEVRKAALKQVQKSKAFKVKQNLERNKNKKQARNKLKFNKTQPKKNGKRKTKSKNLK